MKLIINGEENEVPREFIDKLFGQLYNLGVGEYNKVDKAFRVMGQPLTRLILKKIEEQVAREHGKEISLMFRPPSHTDPTLFLAQLIVRVMTEAMDKHVDATIETDTARHTATAFSVSIPGSGFTGRQVDTGGVERVG